MPAAVEARREGLERREAREGCSSSDATHPTDASIASRPCLICSASSRSVAAFLGLQTNALVFACDISRLSHTQVIADLSLAVLAEQAGVLRNVERIEALVAHLTDV
eukprot:1331606-Rhodomonas_salina.1